MAAIISEKFRIFNAKQFRESLNEAAGTNMYFFVGRPQKWYGYLEIYNVSGTFQVGETITGGGLTATVNEVNANSLLVTATTSTAAPAAGSTVTGGTSTATAKTKTYRYATEDVPPAPIDNQSEKAAVYDDLIAAKLSLIHI